MRMVLPVQNRIHEPTRTEQPDQPDQTEQRERPQPAVDQRGDPQSGGPRDPSPTHAVYRPGTDDASITEVNRRGPGVRNVAGYNLSHPATPWQAIRIDTLHRDTTHLRRELERIDPN